MVNTLNLDRRTGALYGTRGDRFDPRERRWVVLPEVPAEAPVPGERVSLADAVGWLQRDSGHPLRVPIGVIGPRAATVAQLAVAEALGEGLATRGYFELVEHPVAGTHPIPTLPWRARGVDRWIRRPAPLLGQHNAEVLGGRLGCTDAELAALTEDGVIGTRPVGL